MPTRSLYSLITLFLLVGLFVVSSYLVMAHPNGFEKYLDYPYESNTDRNHNMEEIFSHLFTAVVERCIITEQDVPEIIQGYSILAGYTSNKITNVNFVAPYFQAGTQFLKAVPFLDGVWRNNGWELSEEIFGWSDYGLAAGEGANYPIYISTNADIVDVPAVWLRVTNGLYEWTNGTYNYAGTSEAVSVLSESYWTKTPQYQTVYLTNFLGRINLTFSNEITHVGNDTAKLYAYLTQDWARELDETMTNLISHFLNTNTSRKLTFANYLDNTNELPFENIFNLFLTNEIGYVFKPVPGDKDWMIFKSGDYAAFTRVPAYSNRNIRVGSFYYSTNTAEFQSAYSQNVECAIPSICVTTHYNRLRFDFADLDGKDEHYWTASNAVKPVILAVDGALTGNVDIVLFGDVYRATEPITSRVTYATETITVSPGAEINLSSQWVEVVSIELDSGIDKITNNFHITVQYQTDINVFGSRPCFLSARDIDERIKLLKAMVCIKGLHQTNMNENNYAAIRDLSPYYSCWYWDTNSSADMCINRFAQEYVNQYGDPDSNNYSRLTSWDAAWSYFSSTSSVNMDFYQYTDGVGPLKMRPYSEPAHRTYNWFFYDDPVWGRLLRVGYFTITNTYRQCFGVPANTYSNYVDFIPIQAISVLHLSTDPYLHTNNSTYPQFFRFDSNNVPVITDINYHVSAHIYTTTFEQVSSYTDGDGEVSIPFVDYEPIGYPFFQWGTQPDDNGNIFPYSFKGFWGNIDGDIPFLSAQSVGGFTKTSNTNYWRVYDIKWFGSSNINGFRYY